MKIKFIAFLLLGATTVFAQTAKTAKATGDGIFAEMETSKGKITLQLEYQKAPITVANFISLAEGTNTIVDQKHKGKHFYDGLKFHRVIQQFMIQGGDPLGTGSGDPGYKFKDEITDLKHSSGGILSMANSGPGTNGSQFFITHKDTPWLDGKHTIFGHVVSGMEVVNAITQDDFITKVTIIRKGADAKKFDAAAVFTSYFAGKADEEKKALAAAAEAKKVAEQKFAGVKAAKVKYLADVKKGSTKSASGLEYKIVKKGTGVKPADNSQVFIHYAGFLEDGSLFDTSYQNVATEYGKFEQGRPYSPLPSTVGQYQFIPGFVEGLNAMSIGDKAVLFIPSSLGYGEKGAGNVIPPNSNIIFELELLDKMPEPAKK